MIVVCVFVRVCLLFTCLCVLPLYSIDSVVFDYILVFSVFDSTNVVAHTRSLNVPGVHLSVVMHAFILFYLWLFFDRLKARTGPFIAVAGGSDVDDSSSFYSGDDLQSEGPPAK